MAPAGATWAAAGIIVTISYPSPISPKIVTVWIAPINISGWWFGACLIFPFSREYQSQLTNSYFSERLKPPTRYTMKRGKPYTCEMLHTPLPVWRLNPDSLVQDTLLQSSMAMKKIHFVDIVQYVVFLPSYESPFLRDLARVPAFFFPRDFPAGKQSGPAELYPEVELAPRRRCGVVYVMDMDIKK